METKTGTQGDATWRNTDNDAISRRVIDAVAAAKGVDPLELPPLYDAVDPDALDSLFEGGSGAAITELRFEIAGCEVLVRGSDDAVAVRSGADGNAPGAETEPPEDATPDDVGDRCGVDVGGTARFETYQD